MPVLPLLTMTHEWCASGFADAPPDPQYLSNTASCVLVSGVLLPAHDHLCFVGAVYPVAPCGSRRPIHIFVCVVLTPQKEPMTYAASAVVVNVASFPPLVHWEEEPAQEKEFTPSAR